MKAQVLVLLSAGLSQLAFAQTNVYQRHNLISDLKGVADITDANLTNPWGIALTATSPFWISNNHSGAATVYNGNGQPFPVANPIRVAIPAPAGGTEPGAITGEIANGTASFEVAAGKPAAFIFATEDGTISGWNSSIDPANAILKVDNSAAGAVYKGLAMAASSSGPRLYAANFFAGTVDVFDGAFAPVSLAGAFVDPNLPPGFAPFNIQNINGALYVTYALQDEDKHDDVAGRGNGFVNVYDLDGHLLQELVAGAQLNSPWGLAIAPQNFGAFSNALLVGNFGNGLINAFDPSTGAYLGTLQDKLGNPLALQGLWALQFGNGGNGGVTNTLYFTAGISGGDELEDHGLFGSIEAADNLGACASL